VPTLEGTPSLCLSVLCRHKTGGSPFPSYDPTPRRRILSLPHERIKHPSGFKSDALIKRDGPIVGFSYRQRDEADSPPTKVPGRSGQQSLAKPRRAVFGKHADLRDVANISPHQRTENK